ncbi:regucalcin-like [Leptidea sinapis]|uniref:regucalcin-like n=1 Tax=Leptidea sinapis TaxID=189913 RepID=UPI0021443E4C|nr:regucalcin-like [Leptidea sinapis]XP_050672450.1 regucalcin-like [Leptidea sinapis]
MFQTNLLYTLFLISTTLTADSMQYYKISMVSSSSNPDKPAVFKHAESPVWDAETQSLLFVDVLRQNIHRLDYSTGNISTKHIGYGQVNVVCLVAGSRRLLVSVRSALYLLDWEVAGDAALRLLTTVDQGLPDNVINEGKADVEGRFWGGTKGPQNGDDVLPDKAILFSIEQDKFVDPKIHIKPASISNGLAWALNNSILYYVDSPTQRIEAFDFDTQKGELSGRRTIVDITSYGYEDAIPDGMTIDSEGHLWVALRFGGVVLHVDPDARQVVYGYKLPVSHITSVCWGGPNLDELFVTSSKAQSDVKEPLGGAIFTIRGTGSRGVPMFSFRFDNADDY